MKFKYTFKDLEDDDHIRTVTILGVTDNSVECSIQHQRVSHGGYQALSYVWGSADKPYYAEVLGDGTVASTDDSSLGFIPISRNLNSAMRDLWACDDIKSKVFWIDQVCIDQDGPEKNHQVAIMGQIYINALQVITYTGPSIRGPLQDERGINLLRRLRPHFAPNADPLARKEDKVYSIPDPRRLPVRTLPKGISATSQDGDWLWVFGVCLGNWVTRLWMIQEQLLNPMLSLMHGQHLLPWDETMTTLWSLDILPREILNRHLQDCLGPSGRDYINSIFSAWRRRNAKHDLIPAASYTQMSFHDNYTQHGHLDCQDPHDRIFALLGISADANELKIPIDYSKPASEVFRTATVAMLRNDPWRDCLHLATKDGIEDLADVKAASWAISYPRSKKRKIFDLPTDKYAAYPLKLRWVPAFREQDKVLVLKGRIVDQVCIANEPFYSTLSYSKGIIDRAWVESWLALIRSFRGILSACGSSMARVSALADAVVADKEFSAETSQVQRVHHLYCILRVDRPCIDLSHVYDLRYGELGDELRLADAFLSSLRDMLCAANVDCSPLDGSRTEAESFIAESMAYKWRHGGSALCLSKKGRPCAIMNKPEVGDVLVALRSSSLFYCLRPTDRLPSAEGIPRYLAIGSAWIHGLMYGEAYEDWDPDDDFDIEIV